MKYDGPTSPTAAGGQNPEPNKSFMQDDAVTVTTYNMGEPHQSLKGLRKPKLRKLKEKVKAREESADSEGSRGQGLVDNATE